MTTRSIHVAAQYHCGYWTTRCYKKRISIDIDVMWLYWYWEWVIVFVEPLPTFSSKFCNGPRKKQVLISVLCLPKIVIFTYWIGMLVNNGWDLSVNVCSQAVLRRDLIWARVKGFPWGAPRFVPTPH